MTGADLSREGFFRSCTSGTPPAKATSSRVIAALVAGIPTTPVSTSSAWCPSRLDLFCHVLGFNSFCIQRRHHRDCPALHKSSQFLGRHGPVKFTTSRPRASGALDRSTLRPTQLRQEGLHSLFRQTLPPQAFRSHHQHARPLVKARLLFEEAARAQAIPSSGPQAVLADLKAISSRELQCWLTRP